MSVIEGLIAYIKACPLVSEAEYKGPYVDLTKPEPANMAVQASSQSVQKRYMDGTELIEANYVLYIRQYADENPIRKEQNIFLEEFRDWVSAQNRAHIFPRLGETRTARSIEATNGMLFSVSEDGTGIYQIQLKIIYVQGGRRA